MRWFKRLTGSDMPTLTGDVDTLRRSLHELKALKEAAMRASAALRSDEIRQLREQRVDTEHGFYVEVKEDKILWGVNDTRPRGHAIYKGLGWREPRTLEEALEGLARACKKWMETLLWDIEQKCGEAIEALKRACELISDLTEDCPHTLCGWESPEGCMITCGSKTGAVCWMEFFLAGVL